MPQSTHIQLTVYNLLGQEVVRLVGTMHQPDRYETVWDGRNSRGQGVASGVYMYRLASSTGYKPCQADDIIEVMDGICNVRNLKEK